MINKERRVRKAQCHALMSSLGAKGSVLWVAKKRKPKVAHINPQTEDGNFKPTN